MTADDVVPTMEPPVTVRVSHDGSQFCAVLAGTPAPSLAAYGDTRAGALRALAAAMEGR